MEGRVAAVVAVALKVKDIRHIFRLQIHKAVGMAAMGRTGLRVLQEILSLPLLGNPFRAA